MTETQIWELAFFFVDQKIEIGKKPLFRYIVMGRKSLPETTKHTRPYWGFVELVTTNPDDLKKMLAAGVLIEWVEIDHGMMMHLFFFWSNYGLHHHPFDF
jgi:hypothetical protein